MIPNNSSKFYSKSLTLLPSILQMINDGLIATEIAKILGMEKPHLSYYTKKLIEIGYVKENGRGVVKPLELTQAGKNFVAMYDGKPKSQHIPMYRAENIRFKADVIKMPLIPVEWSSVQMHNWIQYGTEVDDIKIHVNMGRKPTIEFIPSPMDGDDPENLRLKLLQGCTDVAIKLEDTLGMKIGTLELSARGEWVAYDPVAKSFSKYNGQLTVDGIGKVNASKPRSIGELEFHDPLALADYMVMPRRLYDVQQDVSTLKQDVSNVKEGIKEIRNLLKEQLPTLLVNLRARDPIDGETSKQQQ